MVFTKADDPVAYMRDVSAARAHAHGVLASRYREELEVLMVEFMRERGWDYLPRRLR